jgi:hypothetical protein
MVAGEEKLERLMGSEHLMFLRGHVKVPVYGQVKVPTPEPN